MLSSPCCIGQTYLEGILKTFVTLTILKSFDLNGFYMHCKDNNAKTKIRKGLIQ